MSSSLISGIAGGSLHDISWLHMGGGVRDRNTSSMDGSGACDRACGGIADGVTPPAKPPTTVCCDLIGWFALNGGFARCGGRPLSVGRHGVHMHEVAVTSSVYSQAVPWSLVVPVSVAPFAVSAAVSVAPVALALAVVVSPLVLPPRLRSARCLSSVDALLVGMPSPAVSSTFQICAFRLHACF